MNDLEINIDNRRAYLRAKNSAGRLWLRKNFTAGAIKGNVISFDVEHIEEMMERIRWDDLVVEHV